ncbi:MAG: RseC/MucC family positive regulator of sigma(E) [Bacteroidetes bacterium]|nr:MAG: RseC/MucC family positive regulator of sigma(E) [Bacteroidota bacterium]
MKTLKETEISHIGTVQSIDDDILNIRIVSSASCVSCSSKSSCSASDMEEKIINVRIPEGKEYKVGDSVIVVLSQSVGLKAVMLGYIYPFLVMFVSLIVMVNITDNQGMAGLVSLAMLIPYYSALYATRHRQKEIFDFRIK